MYIFNIILSQEEYLEIVFWNWQINKAIVLHILSLIWIIPTVTWQDSHDIRFQKINFMKSKKSTASVLLEQDQIYKPWTDTQIHSVHHFHQKISLGTQLQE